jgi:hypothetical protein
MIILDGKKNQQRWISKKSRVCVPWSPFGLRENYRLNFLLDFMERYGCVGDNLKNYEKKARTSGLKVERERIGFV